MKKLNRMLKTFKNSLLEKPLFRLEFFLFSEIHFTI